MIKNFSQKYPALIEVTAKLFMEDKKVFNSKANYSVYNCTSKEGRDYGFSNRNSALPHTSSYPIIFKSTNQNRLPYNNFKRQLSDTPARNLDYERKLFVKSHSSSNVEEYDKIKVSVDGPDAVIGMNTFKDIDLGEVINFNIELCHFDKPTPIQKHSIPNLLKGKDIMACAQTGSGKTASYLLPVIYQLNDKFNSRNSFEKSRQDRQEPYALIMAPTRELVQQIEMDARRLSYRTFIKVATAFGGVSVSSQIYRIEQGCDILIATPGRLNDFIRRDVITLRNCRYLVFDEADRMLDMGFEPQIRTVMSSSKMPPKEARQTLMFSATFPTQIQRLAKEFLNNEIRVTIGRIGAASSTILQKFEYIQEYDKLNRLVQLVEEIKNENENAHILIFVQTKYKVDELEFELFHRKHKVVSIHGDRSQNERDEALHFFKQKIAYIMVATDVAQRGLDIPSVTHVINYNMPAEVENYVHRIGRTGRVGNTGISISFYNEDNSALASELISHLLENKQEVPQFLHHATSHKSSSSYGGKYRSNQGNNRYSRNNDRWRNSEFR